MRCNKWFKHYFSSSIYFMYFDIFPHCTWYWIDRVYQRIIFILEKKNLNIIYICHFPFTLSPTNKYFISVNCNLRAYMFILEVWQKKCKRDSTCDLLFFYCIYRNSITICLIHRMLVFCPCHIVISVIEL